MPRVRRVRGSDSRLRKVERGIRTIASSAKRPLAALFGGIVRQAMDEVIDGPRTGRWSLSQLTKTEKTYVGTKIEILVRDRLALKFGVGIDTVIAGVGVDVKWSQSLDWMIGRENVGQVCLGLGLGDEGRRFSVGLFRASESNLRPGANQDRKRSLSAAAMAAEVCWLVRNELLPTNFVAELPEKIRARIFSGRTAQERLRLLAELVPRTPIPRHAIETVAMTDDPLRRTRRDSYRESPLGEMALLSTKYGKRTLAALGISPLPANHWVAVRLAELP